MVFWLLAVVPWQYSAYNKANTHFAITIPPNMPTSALQEVSQIFLTNTVTLERLQALIIFAGPHISTAFLFTLSDLKTVMLPVVS
jgi:hypothetical protein